MPADLDGVEAMMKALEKQKELLETQKAEKTKRLTEAVNAPPQHKKRIVEPPTEKKNDDTGDLDEDQPDEEEEDEEEEANDVEEEEVEETSTQLAKINSTTHRPLYMKLKRAMESSQVSFPNMAKLWNGSNAEP